MADLRKLLLNLTGSPAGAGGGDANLHAWTGTAWAKVSGLAAFGTMKVHVQLIGSSGLPIANDGLQLSVSPTKDGGNYRTGFATSIVDTEVTVLAGIGGSFFHMTSITVGNSSATPVVMDVNSKPAGAGTKRFELFVPAGDSRTHFFGLWGHRTTISEGISITSDTAVSTLYITVQGYISNT